MYLQLIKVKTIQLNEGFNEMFKAKMIGNGECSIQAIFSAKSCFNFFDCLAKL